MRLSCGCFLLVTFMYILSSSVCVVIYGKKQENMLAIKPKNYLLFVLGKVLMFSFYLVQRGVVCSQKTLRHVKLGPVMVERKECLDLRL